ncbi:MAG: SUMF1/EgtB/PvdO family nonheme iron enzyme [Myxococcota bacterium]
MVALILPWLCGARAAELDAHEVSIGAFERFVRAAYDDPSLWSEAGWRWHQSARRPDRDDRRAGRALDHPVVAVSYYEAEAYCRWEGKRLPSASAWQHACAADPSPALCAAPGQARPERPRTQSTEAPTAMRGSVWEWTTDEQVSGGPWKVLVGGSFLSNTGDCQCAATAPARPETAPANVGFRCTSG